MSDERAFASRTTAVRWLVCSGSAASFHAGTSCFGIASKYWCTSTIASSVSKSPDSVSTALFGA